MGYKLSKNGLEFSVFGIILLLVGVAIILLLSVFSDFGNGRKFPAFGITVIPIFLIINRCARGVSRKSLSRIQTGDIAAISIFLASMVLLGVAIVFGWI